jgi:UDPglucose 6-dehydrogenase
MATTHGTHPQLLKAVMDINQYQRIHVIQKLRDLLGQRFKGKVIGLLGLAFKPNTDDMREAPAAEIARALIREGATVKGYDPEAMTVAAKMVPSLHLAKDAYDLAKDCDALILLTEWNEFKHLDMPQIKSLMRQPNFIDGRNLYDSERMTGYGFIYRGVGRGYASS